MPAPKTAISEEQLSKIILDATFKLDSGNGIKRIMNGLVIGQSWRVGRACPQRAGLRLTVCGGALRTGAPYLPLSLGHYVVTGIFPHRDKYFKAFQPASL